MDGLCEWVGGVGTRQRRGLSCVSSPTPRSPTGPGTSIFSADGSMLAMSGQHTPAVVVWDTRSGEIIATPTVPHDNTPDGVHDAAFSPTGDRLAASLGSELWMFSTDDWRDLAQYLPPATSEAVEHSRLTI